MKKKYNYRTSFTFDGKRYDIKADTIAELYEKKVNKKRDLEEGRILLSPHMTVRQWTEQALDTYKATIKYETLKNMTYRINKHILSVIGDLPISSVKPIQCQKILNSQNGMSRSHIRSITQELHFIFDTAKRNHLIIEDPTENIQPPRGHAGTRQALSDTERTALLAAVDQDPSYILFLLMLQCGCRPAEAIRAQGFDIEQMEDAAVLHIRGTKTENADRRVPIPPDLYGRIKNTDPFAPISPNRSGRMHTESSYKRLVEHLKRDMNILMGCKLYRNKLVPPFPLRESFVPYDLRHTYCTDLAKAGIDIRIAQKLMGHATISITAQIYTHISDQMAVNEAIDKLSFHTGFHSKGHKKA